MEQIRDVDSMQQIAQGWRREGKRCALVPTMGALHEGHLALIDRARESADSVVASIFVNPAQFGPGEDLGRYPRQLEQDIALLQQRGCDMVFTPCADALYPQGFDTWVVVETLTRPLCGQSRPSHFRGVTTVVCKLLQITQPHVAVFGQKDAQQCIVVRQMVRDLCIPVAIEVVGTVREADGLAMSSRNAYLAPNERQAATALYRGLCGAEALFASGERTAARILDAARTAWANEPLLREEYCVCVDVRTLEPLEHVSATALLALACRSATTQTRLIDNSILGGKL